MRWRAAAVACLCVVVLGAGGTALGAGKLKVKFEVPTETTTLDEMTSHGIWLKFNIERAGPSQESFEAIGQPIAWGQARCLSLSYRATQQPTIWAVGFEGNRAHQFVWSEFLVSNPAKTPLGNLASIGGFSESPIGATFLAVAASCHIPLDV